ncbi:hypothetical protein BGP_1774 [Beggiatoa sp. PS]|nr:hypothetical protein BGP_1774 [Beggiatoa sp. PS]
MLCTAVSLTHYLLPLTPYPLPITHYLLLITNHAGSARNTSPIINQ